MLVAQVLRGRARRMAMVINKRWFSSSNSPQDEKINFIKDVRASGLIKRGTGLHKKDLEDQYSSDNHSLLPYLYMFKFNTDNIGYVLLEPSTRSLIAIDLGEFEISHKVITEIETSQRAQLKYILTTHHHSDH